MKGLIWLIQSGVFETIFTLFSYLLTLFSSWKEAICGNCAEISARVILKMNILGSAKFFDYIKGQLHHWNVPMIYQNVSEYTINPPELLFKKVLCIYVANL